MQKISEELRGDREIVLAAVRQSSLALQYASKALQRDPEIIRIAEQRSSPANEI